MFGVLRTTLAIMVMVFHIFIGYLPIGTYAVFGFFIISGYLMTYIMHQSYGYTLKGRLIFGLNRFLRLHPLYWLAAAISLFLIYYLGSDVVFAYHKSMTLPPNDTSILQNTFMIYPSFIPGSIHPRLVPPTWAITIEMFYYALICFGISKTLNRVKLWFILSVLYVVYTFISGQPWKSRYFHLFAASLPFSIGAAIYFLRQQNSLNKYINSAYASPAKLFILMLINCLVWSILPRNTLGTYIEIGFYLNVIICALLVYKISQGEPIVKLNRKVDKLIGDFSYPIYLLHLLGGLLASYLLFGQARLFHRYSTNGLINFLLSALIVLVVSAVFIFIFDKPIQKLRLSMKQKHNHKR